MNKKTIARILAGLLVISAGAALLFSNLNIAPFSELINRGWPIAIIIIGFIMLINDFKSYLWSLVVMAVGATLLLNKLDVIDVNVWQLFWPVVIIVVGVSIITNHATTSSKNKKLNTSSRGDEDIMVFLSGSQQNNYSDNFEGSKVTAIAGGAVLNLREAKIKKEATVDVFAFWAGVEIIVPDNVLVEFSTSNLLGGVEDNTKPPKSKDAPVLHIAGEVIMSGIEIKN